MIKRIKIPGTRETKTCIRVYTCYNHQLKRNVVDTEKFFDDIETPKNFNFGNHDTCVSLIKKWAENKSDKTLLAYQGVRVEFIKDDRSSLGHQSFSSQKDLGTIGQKIFVFSDFRILISDRILSMKNLGEDVAWIQKILKSSGLARDRYEKEARDRERPIQEIVPIMVLGLDDCGDCRPLHGVSVLADSNGGRRVVHRRGVGDDRASAGN